VRIEARHDPASGGAFARIMHPNPPRTRCLARPASRARSPAWPVTGFGDRRARESVARRV